MYNHGPMNAPREPTAAERELIEQLMLRMQQGDWIHHFDSYDEMEDWTFDRYWCLYLNHIELFDQGKDEQWPPGTPYTIEDYIAGTWS